MRGMDIEWKQMKRMAEQVSYEGVILGSSLINSTIVYTDIIIFLLATLPTDWLQMIGTSK